MGMGAILDLVRPNKKGGKDGICTLGSVWQRTILNKFSLQPSLAEYKFAPAGWN